MVCKWGAVLCLGVDSHHKSVVWKKVLAAFHFTDWTTNWVFFKRSFDVAVDACGLSCQWLPTSLASHPQAHFGGIFVLFRGSVLLLLQTPPLSHPSRLCGALTHGFSCVFSWLFLLPQPCPENMCARVDFCSSSASYGLLLSLINSFVFLFSSFTSSLRERVEEEPPAWPFSMFLSALRRHDSPSTSGVAGLGHIETGFQGGWMPVTGV